MHLLEIVVVALALSLDAFAVSLAASTSGHVYNRRAAFRLSFHFGLFQFLMPIQGWTLGTTIAPVIAAFDHWIAFALLGFVAARMIRSRLNPDAVAQADDPSRGLVLVMLSTATSIDALAVGLSLAMLNIDVWFPSVVIGIITAAMCVIAISGGARVSARLGDRAQIAGGLILLLIAGRIVATHIF